MNIDGLLNRYFGDSGTLPVIEMFDSESIHTVYKDIVNTLKMQPDIDLGILQTLSYCFYEILDNVLTHSMKQCGTVVMKYSPNLAKIQIMVVDDGIGIYRSLTENEAYHDISEAEALAKCMLGIMLKLHSGNHMLTSNGVEEKIEETDFWQGTVVYFELYSDKEIDPNVVLENRADAVSEFNDEFLNTEDMDNLW